MLLRRTPYLVLANVDARNLRAEFGKASTGDEPHVAGTQNNYMHAKVLQIATTARDWLVFIRPCLDK